MTKVISKNTKIEGTNYTLGDVAKMMDKVASHDNSWIMCSLDGNLTISKSGTYGGVEVTFNQWTSGGGSDTFFEHKNGRIYVKKPCKVFATFSIGTNFSSPTNTYSLFGRNGGYTYVFGPSEVTGLTGVAYTGCGIFDLGADSYLTLQIGAVSAFSNAVVFNGGRLTACVISATLLD